MIMLVLKNVFEVKYSGVCLQG